jgi:hypothetical protein
MASASTASLFGVRFPVPDSGRDGRDPDFRPAAVLEGRCRACGEWKPLPAFAKDPARPNGRAATCRACVREA